MEVKEIEVDCPCCATRLTIDVLTRTVLRATPRKVLDEMGKAKLEGGRWNAATDQVAGRVAGAQDKLEDALSKERGKESRLDELFEKARKKLERRGDEEGP